MLETSHQHIAYHIGLESCILRIDPNSGLMVVLGFFYFTWYIPLLWVFLYLPPVFATIVLSFPLCLMRIISFSKLPRANQILSPGVFAKVLNPVSQVYFSLFQFYFLSPFIQHSPVNALLLCQLILPSPAVPSMHSPFLPLAGPALLQWGCTDLILAIALAGGGWEWRLGNKGRYVLSWKGKTSTSSSLYIHPQERTISRQQKRMGYSYRSTGFRESKIFKCIDPDDPF